MHVQLGIAHQHELRERWTYKWRHYHRAVSVSVYQQRQLYGVLLDPSQLLHWWSLVGSEKQRNCLGLHTVWPHQKLCRLRNFVVNQNPHNNCLYLCTMCFKIHPSRFLSTSSLIIGRYLYNTSSLLGSSVNLQIKFHKISHYAQYSTSLH